MSNSTRKFGLIGKTLSHSFSQGYFTDKFQKNNIEASYENLEIDSIEEVKNLFSQGFTGFNVTIPYKEAIIPFLDELSPEASAVGSVNTISVTDKIRGHNTDTFGFRQMIKPFFKSHHERALILGTGGAAKAVSYILEQLGVSVIYVSRNPQGDNQFSYDEINENMIAFNGIIVNTTPIGMYPRNEEIVNIPYEHISEKHLVIDLIYNPEETLFLSRAREQGAWTLNGLTMLHQQAEKAWGIWNK